ncbi:MAG: O-acetyl-ADP-ribose deacetylase [Mucilaginibacter polytrichastri]|nr:O-acetyl-ADP-ribose deacetylase [Mucilaginibacter polytrichastri]
MTNAGRIRLLKGDITKIEADAIVNAANNTLLGGGGVDGAIHRAGGPEILRACRIIHNEKGGCPTGEAVITTAGKLPAKFVIHTVGPVWKGGSSNEPEVLKGCYENSLRLAEKNGVKTLAFPNISTGIYGYPKDKAAKIAVDTVRHYVSHAEMHIIFVCFDDDNYALYQQLLKD